jgi:hypothetical protein
VTKKKKGEGALAARGGKKEEALGFGERWGAVKKGEMGAGGAAVVRCDVSQGAHALCVEEDDIESHTASVGWVGPEGNGLGRRRRGEVGRLLGCSG